MVPSSASPHVQQFLSSVLSQRGPSALPYSEDTKWLIRNHLVTLTGAYPSLEPRTATFSHNDGRSVNLLQADGTIPMPFDGVNYNIPVVIWLMESYPRYPPVVYVNPTRDMVIKRPHPHVNPSGLVSIPCLQNWIYPSSNLVDLVGELSRTFSRDPPLYSQRRPAASPTPSHSFGSPGPSEYARPPAVIHHTSHLTPTPRPYPPPSPYGGAGRAQTDDAAEVHKKNAITKIMEMAHGDMTAMGKTKESEVEGLFSAQAVLRQRVEEVNRGLKEMLDEKEGLEAQLQVVLMNIDVLEGWVREHEGKVKNSPILDLDNAIECTDVLSKQVLECTAADLAIDDAIYSLDKAVQEGVIPFDQYLRNVRLLSREQFFHRATAAKVRAAQMQSQVSSMAARSTHYAT